MRAFLALCVLIGANAYVDNCKCAPDCLPTLPTSEVEVEAKFTTWLRGLFPERKHPPDEVLEDAAQANVILTSRSNVTVTFMWEGAGFRNELGYYLYDANNQIIVPSGDTNGGLNVLFPDVSFRSTGCLEIGDTVTFGPFDAGTRIGWYLRANGYKRSNVPTFYSFNDTSRNPDNLKHVALAVDADTKKMLIGFEDIRGGGDRDYNDAMFVVSVEENAYDDSGMPVIKDGQLISCNSTANITFSVEQDGYRYALLDNTDPTDTSAGCQRERIEVPAGWQTVPNEARHRAAVSSYPWGTTCVVLADGTAYMPATGQACGTGYLDTSISTCLGTTQCGRVLVMKATSVNGNPNPTMTSTNGQLADDWATYGANGYVVSRDTKSGTGNSVKVCNDYVRDTTGNAAVLTLTNQEILTHGGTFAAWSKSEEVLAISGANEVEYSIFLDIYYSTGSAEFGVSVGYRGRTHGFEYREVVWRPQAGRTATEIRVHLLLRGVSGCAYFSDVTITSHPPLNILSNPSFAERTTLLSETDAKYWFQMDATANTYTPEIDSAAVETVSCAGTPTGNCGAQQFVTFTVEEQAAQDWNTLFVYGCSKSTGVTQASGVPDLEYSVYVDIWYADGTKQYARVLPFEASSGAWQCLSGTFSVKSTTSVSQVNVAPLYRKTETQTVSFDTMFVRPIKRVQSLNEAIAYGDPHVWSWDNEQYDVMAVGEFILFQDSAVTVQVRHSAVGAEGVVASVVSAFAVEYDTGILQVERATGTSSLPTLRVNGGLIKAVSGDQVAILGNTTTGFTLVLSGAINGQASGGQQLTYTALLPTDHEVQAVLRTSSFGIQFFSVKVTAPPASGVVGLLGGMTSGSGTFGTASSSRRLTTSPQGRRLLQQSALDAVRVTDTSSAFAYRDNRTTESYTDRANDNRVTDLTVSFSAAQIASARATCLAAGVSTETVQSCMLDVLALGDNSAASATAAAQTSAGKRTTSAIAETSPAAVTHSTSALLAVALFAAVAAARQHM